MSPVARFEFLSQCTEFCKPLLDRTLASQALGQGGERPASAEGDAQWRNDWPGEGALRRRLNKLSWARWLPQDRRLISGLPRSREERRPAAGSKRKARVATGLNGHESRLMNFQAISTDIGVICMSLKRRRRGRDGDCSPPPAQIPVSGTTPPGSPSGHDVKPPVGTKVPEFPARQLAFHDPHHLPPRDPARGPDPRRSCRPRTGPPGIWRTHYSTLIHLMKCYTKLLKSHIEMA
jgi:hypothetical protein